MKVRIKLGKTQFINTKIRHEGDIITLVSRKHSVTGEEITIDSQFNKDTMEKVEPVKPGEPVKPVKHIKK